MNGAEEPRPPRRKRYSGKNPRRFEDKYKEHDPARFSDTVAKVLASGKTPAGMHVPVMPSECMAALDLCPGITGIDCTLGYGGHALEILRRISPGGKLIGLDRDTLQIPLALARIRAAGYGTESFDAVRSNFAGIGKVLAVSGFAAVDFIFADLGCSSMQYDDPARGFSFKHGGPLDMRMDPQRGISAREWLAEISAGELAEILAGNSDEPHAVEIAERIAGQDFPLADALAAAVRGVPGVSDLDLTLKRVFQAIRIEVNDEFGSLNAFLRTLPFALRAGGRTAILTFHSGEDRRVKKAFQAGLRDGIFSATNENVILATAGERRANPRSIPAKLRWAVRA